MPYYELPVDELQCFQYTFVVLSLASSQGGEINFSPYYDHVCVKNSGIRFNNNHTLIPPSLRANLKKYILSLRQLTGTQKILRKI